MGVEDDPDVLDGGRNFASVVPRGRGSRKKRESEEGSAFNRRLKPTPTLLPLASGNHTAFPT